MTLQRTAACLAFAAITAAAGCSLIADYDGFQGAAAPDSGAPVVPECGKGIPEQKPEAPTGGTIKLSGLAKQIRFFDAAKTASYGYDLDRTCTGQNGAKGSCTNASIAQNDLPGGVDNVLGSFLASTDFVNTPDIVSATVQTGQHGVYVEVENYNGKPDANQVKVSIYNYAGYAGGGPAKFDGTDQVIPTEDSFIKGSGFSRFIDSAAYVTNGVLVANILNYDLRLSIPKRIFAGADAGDETAIVAFPLQEAKLIGTIQAKGDGLSMPDAQIVGRLTIGAIVKELGHLAQCDVTTYLNALCPNLDLAGRAAEDRTGAKCVAVSAAVGLEIVGAKRAPAAPAPSVVEYCEAGAPPACP